MNGTYFKDPEIAQLFFGISTYLIKDVKIREHLGQSDYFSVSE